MKPFQKERRPHDGDAWSDLVIRGSAIRVATFLITAATGFFLTPFILHSLGDHLYGLWALIGTFVTYFALFDLGISSAVQRFVSQALGRKDPQQLQSAVVSASVIFLLMGIVTVLLSILVPLIVPRYLSVSPDVRLLGQLVTIVGIGFGLSLPGRVFEGVLAAQLRQDILSFVWLGNLLVQTGLIVLVLSSGNSIRSLAIVLSTMIVVRFSVITVVGVRSYDRALATCTSPVWKEQSDGKTTACIQRPHEHPSGVLKHISIGQIRKLLHYGMFTLLNRIGDYLRFHLDNIVIGGVLGLAQITLYVIPVKLLEYFTNLMLSSVGFLGPLFSRYEGRADMDTLRARFLDVTRISVMIATFTGSSLLLYGKAFIARWVGSSYVSSYGILLILGVPATLALMQNPGISVLYGISRHHYYTVANTAEGLLNLLLSVILVKKLGVYGVALGTALPMLVFKTCIQPVYTCRFISLPVLEYYRLIVTVLLQTLLPIMLYFVLFRTFLEPTYTSMIPIWAGQVLAFAPIAWWVILRDEDRRAIRNAVLGP